VVETSGSFYWWRCLHRVRFYWQSETTKHSCWIRRSVSVCQYTAQYLIVYAAKFECNSVQKAWNNLNFRVRRSHTCALEGKVLILYYFLSKFEYFQTLWIHCCPHLQCPWRTIIGRTLKIQAEDSSETQLPIYQLTRHHSPNNHNFFALVLSSCLRKKNINI